MLSSALRTVLQVSLAGVLLAPPCAPQALQWEFYKGLDYLAVPNINTSAQGSTPSGGMLLQKGLRAQS